MFVISFKTGKRKIVLALAVTLVALTAVLVAARVSSHSMSGLPAGETNEERLSFLALLGLAGRGGAPRDARGADPCRVR